MVLVVSLVVAAVAVVGVVYLAHKKGWLSAKADKAVDKAVDKVS